jgi:hypothetical protein
MSFKKLLETLSEGNTEAAVEIAKSLETDFNANVQEIDKLESKASEAISGRDKLKSKLRELSEAAGVDDLTADAIKEIKSKRGGDSEIEAKYKEQLDNAAKTIEELEGNYKSKLQDADSRYQSVLIDKELTKLGANVGLADGAIDDVVSHLKANATIDGEQIVYMRDGVQERGANGRPLTISEKLTALKESKPFYFKADVQGGSGTPHQPGGSSTQTKTFKERQQERYGE